MSNDKKLKVVFQPGCFDMFEGTQSELDELIAEITKMAEDGTLEENTHPLDIDSLDADELIALSDALDLSISDTNTPTKRVLN